MHENESVGVGVKERESVYEYVGVSVHVSGALCESVHVGVSKRVVCEHECTCVSMYVCECVNVAESRGLRMTL